MPVRPRSRRAALRAVLLAVGLALAAYALVRNGADLREALTRLTPWSLVAGLLAVLLGAFCSLLSWRALLTDLGSPLPLAPAVRVFFLSQLGKYVPGSVWTVVSQMELAREHGVPRSRSGTVGLLTLALSLAAGLLAAVVALPFAAGDALSRYWWAFLPVPLLLVALHPRTANPLLDRLLRLARRGGLERPLSGRGVTLALAWAVAAWVAYGVKVWVLAVDLDADPVTTLPLAVGGFALAWTAGFLFVVAPAGAGVREVALVVALAPALGADEALLVALVSRALMTAGDLVWAGAAVVAARRHGSVLPVDEPVP